MTMRIFSLAAALLASSIAVPASALTLSVSLPDFDGPSNGSGFPIDLGTIGTFNYALPMGSTITAAFFEGTYGTQALPSSTAGFDAVIDGTTLTVCVPNDPGCWDIGANFRPFSFSLPSTAFAALADGSAALGIIQTNEAFVRLGSPTLRIEYDLAGAVPEPATWGMMIAGFGLMGAAMRRRARVSAVRFAN